MAASGHSRRLRAVRVMSGLLAIAAVILQRRERSKWARRRHRDHALLLSLQCAWACAAHGQRMLFRFDASHSGRAVAADYLDDGLAIFGPDEMRLFGRFGPYASC